MTSAPHPRLVGELPRSADVVIVGGGIAGAASAFFAARAGLRCLLLEARPALATLTTSVSAGAFRLQFDNPEEIALVRESVDLYTSFAARTGLDGYDIGLHHGGYLFCTTTPAGATRQRRWVAAQHAWGLTDVELLSGDEARYRFPYLAPDVLQARFRALDGWLDPVRLALGFVVASGVAISLATPATGFVLAGDRVCGVTTARGPIACDQVILAAGPFSARLAARAGLSLAVRPTRRQKLILPDFPAVPRDAPMTIDEETAAHWRPALGGALALRTDPTTKYEEPLEDVPTSSDFAFGLLDPDSPQALARVSPFWATAWAEGGPAWILQAGQYDYTPDRRPLLGPSDVPGLILNTGYSGHGIMAGGAGSRITVDAMLGKLAGAANPFAVSRQFARRPHDIL